MLSSKPETFSGMTENIFHRLVLVDAAYRGLIMFQWYGLLNNLQKIYLIRIFIT